MSENQPADPGTQPDLVIPEGDVLTGIPVLAPVFKFADGERPYGPLGPKPGDYDPRSVVPRLGIPSPSRTPSVFTVPTATGNPVGPIPIDVAKPTLMLMISNTIATSDSIARFLYFPEVSFEPFLNPIAGNTGFQFSGADIFLWAPGRWYVGCIIATLPRQVSYMLIECESPQIFDYLRQQYSTVPQQLSHTILAAAVIGTLVNLPDVLRCRRITLQNVGANTAFVTWGNATPSATRGFPLAAGERRVLEGPDLPTQQLRGFSTLGTSISIDRQDKPWIR